jgi:AcrR family transcriptional regulator
MQTMEHNATKIAVLDAAERLFATRGFDRTSLRTITAGARANLGAVNYHFKTKDDLIVAVLRRRIRPINTERLALLRQFQDQANGRPVPVRKILEAFFRPAIEALATPSKGGPSFLKLVSLALAEPGTYLLPLIREEFGVTAGQFHAALRQKLPHLSNEDVYWKLHFAVGAFVHTVAHAHVLKVSSQGLCKIRCIEETLDRIVTFCAGGFEARNDSVRRKKS